jgi:hypothetical protein
MQKQLEVGNFVKFNRDGKKGRIIKSMDDNYFVVYLPSRATIVVHANELTFLPKREDKE